MKHPLLQKGKQFFHQSMRRRLILPVLITMISFFAINLVLFAVVNSTVEDMNQVYSTNIRLGELEECIVTMDGNVHQYLNIRSEEALQALQQNKLEILDMIADIDDTITDHPIRQSERNIRQLTLSWIALIEQAVHAKQAHDMVTYKADYIEIQKIYQYLLEYMRGLDDMQFSANFANYSVLYQYLRYLQVFVVTVLVVATFHLVARLYGTIEKFTSPLEKLTYKALAVEKGDFHIALEEPENDDEVGTVTRAFNQMIASINDYIRKSRESLELEMQMKERELLMENLLKDAQLKYYQAQINPHFLFNTLNAGQQLAMMEEADRTYEFIENMASFYRYRLKSSSQSTTLRSEVQLVDNYMYIMNIRYSNEIRFEKKIDESLLDIRFPNMVLQPILENALSHGLGGVEWEKRVWVTIEQVEEEAVITVVDNGLGIAPEILTALQSAEPYPSADSTAQMGSKNGVGLWNVRERLQLYFNRNQVMTIQSGGQNQGATFIIRVPILRDDGGLLATSERS